MGSWQGSRPFASADAQGPGFGVIRYSGSEPLFAVLWLGEALTPVAWLGGLLVVAATLWASLSRSCP